MELEAEKAANWRLCSATLVRGVSGERRKPRTGDFVVQL